MVRAAAGDRLEHARRPERRRHGFVQDRDLRGDGVVYGAGTQRDVVPESEVLQRDEEVLQGAAQADMQLPLVRVGDSLPARELGVERDLVPADREPPGLRIAVGGREHRVADEVLQLLLAGAQRVVVRVAERPGIGREGSVHFS